MTASLGGTVGVVAEIPGDDFEIRIDGKPLGAGTVNCRCALEPVLPARAIKPLDNTPITISRTIPLSGGDREYWLRRALGEFDA